MLGPRQFTTMSLSESLMPQLASRRRTMVFVLDFPLVSPGKCGQPLYLTPLQSPLSHPAGFFSPLHLIASQDRPCATGREPPPPHMGRRYLRAVPNLPFITVNKQNQFEAPLSSGSVIYNIRSLVPPSWTRCGCRCRLRVLKLGTCLPASERLGDFDEDRFLSLGFVVEAWEDVCAVKQLSETYSIHPSVPLPPLYPQRSRGETYSIP